MGLEIKKILMVDRKISGRSLDSSDSSLEMEERRPIKHISQLDSVFSVNNQHLRQSRRVKRKPIWKDF